MITIEDRIKEALSILTVLGLPHEQLNDRTAITLLALLDLPAEKQWRAASDPLLGIRAILDFARQKLQRNYAENSRESFRKYSVKQLVAAGVLLHNPDKPDRDVNSSDNCYQVSSHALELFRLYGSKAWADALQTYLLNGKTLAAKYAAGREVVRLPLRIKGGLEVKLSAGGHSELIISIIEEFGSIFLPGGELVYVGDTGKKWGYFDAECLYSLGVKVGAHGKMPDVVIYDRARNWLILAEAVTSGGPVDGGRHQELAELFKDSKAGLVFVTAFPDRGAIFRRFLSTVAWETEVWCASDPTHMIHLNGIRFLGPYKLSK